MSASFRWIRLMAAVAALAGGLAIGAAPGTVHAATDGFVTIDKQLVLPVGVTQPSIPNVAPPAQGDTFIYRLAYGCTTNLGYTCDNLTITDVVPAELEVIGSYPPAFTITSNGDGTTTVVIAVGTISPSNGSFDINVRFRNNLTLATNDTVTALNVATADAIINTEDAAAESDGVSVTGIVKPIGGASAAKSISPSPIVEFSDSDVTVTLTGTNTGTIDATEMVITDVEPAFFDSFDLVSVPALASPGVVETFDGTTWSALALPYSAGPINIEGIRVRYTTPVPAGTPLSLPVVMRLRDATATVVPGDVVPAASISITNNITSTVSYDPDTSLNSGASASAPVTVTGVVVNPPTLSKTFSPNVIEPGSAEPVTIALVATNSGAGGLSSMTISDPDPDPGSDNPFPAVLDVTGVAVVWGTGAAVGQTATLTTNCGTASIVNPATTFTLPGGCTPSTIITVSVTFTAAAGQSLPSNYGATVNINTVVQPDASTTPTAYPNDAQVTSVSAATSPTTISNSTEATNVSLTIAQPTYNITTDKSFARPSTFSTYNTVLLPTTLEAGSGALTRLVIQDPTVVPTTDGTVDFWEQFEMLSVREVDCDLPDTVLIEVYNYVTAAWQTVTANGCGSSSIDLSTFANAAGIRFTYSKPGGITAPFNVTPEIAVHYLATPREGPPVPLPVVPQPALMSSANCSVALAYNNTTVPVDTAEVSPPNCKQITFNPRPVGPGLGVSKVLSSTSGLSGREGSHRQVTATISATSGTFPADKLTMEDPIDPEDLAPTGSALYSRIFASAMDIVSVSYTVPQFERAQLQYYTGGVWVTVDTKTGGQVITGPRNNAAAGWRIVLTENPADPGFDPGLEPSTTLGGAAVTVVYELRDTMRDTVGAHLAGNPVLNNVCYNGSGPLVMIQDPTTGDPTSPACNLTVAPFTSPGVATTTDGGWLQNNTEAALEYNGVVLFESIDQLTANEKEFRVLDGTVNVAIDKQITPATIPVPNSGDVPGVAQRTTISLRPSNTSPGSGGGPGVNADQVVVTDNSPTFWNAFAFISATVTGMDNPATAPIEGSTSVTFDVTRSVGGPLTGQTLSQLNALGGPASTVTGVVARFNNVPSVAGGGVQPVLNLVTQLRNVAPYNTNVNSYVNDATASIIDIVAATTGATDQATVTTRPGAPGVTTTKTASIVAPNAVDLRPLVNVTVRSTNSGEIGITTLVSEDDDVYTVADYATPSVPATLPPSGGDFWSIVDMVSITAVTAPIGAESATFEYFDGTTWIAAGSYTVGATLTVANLNAAMPTGAALTTVKGLRIAYRSTTGTDIRPGEFGQLGFQTRIHQDAPTGVAVTNCAESGFGYAITGGTFGQYQNPGCASITPQLGTLRVDVSKLFLNGTTSNTVSPGTNQTYTLSFTNTGQQAIGLHGTAPLTIVDQMPVGLDYNASTANLQIVTVPAVPVTSNLTMAPVISDDTANNRLLFVWPAGQYLGAGETLRITVTLEVAAALPANSQIVNTAGINMALAANCTPPDTYSAGRCNSSATLTISTGGALRAAKAIEGEDGNVPVASGATCPAAGFVSYPCAAVTSAGSTYTWRLSMQNSGNTPLNRVVMIDRLPAVGDSGAYTSFPRGSEWRGVPSTLPVVVAPGLVTAPIVEYLPPTANATTCLQELTLPGGTRCGAWVTIMPGDDATVLATAIAIRIQADYGVGANPTFAAGSTITVTWDETTPDNLAASATDTANAVGTAAADGRLTEWNSFGYRAYEGQTLYRNESVKAGAVFDSAGLVVTKMVSEDTLLDPQDYGPFDFTATCTTPAGAEEIFEFTLAHGGAHTILGLPTGTECTIAEAASASAPVVTFAPSATVILTPTVQFGTVTVDVVNQYGEGASIYIGKVVRGVTTDKDFQVTVTCVDFNGNALVLADGDTYTINDGDPVAQIAGLPVGASCRLIEDGQHASYTQYNVGTDKPTLGNELVVDDIAGGETVTFTNSYVATFVVTKHVDNATIAPDESFGPFEFTVECTVSTGVQEVVSSSNIRSGDSFAWTGGELLAGTSCTITETNSDNATSITIATMAATEGIAVPTVALVQGPNTVAVTNTFDPVSLRVTKTVRGIELAPGAAYGFSLTCTFDGVAIVFAAGDAAFTLTAGSSKIITGLAEGTTCVVAETSAGGAFRTSRVVNAGASAIGDSATVDLLDAMSTVDFVNEFALVLPPTTTTQPTVPPSSTPLPYTGSDVAGSLLVALLALLGGGLLVVVTRRRRQAAE